tara:strand:- start:43 stop:483 length:441 start_codon:yes stop_codon:yes gene_type:complete
MTSQLNVDAIVDKAGSGGSNVKMANTSTYVSDGGNVTRNTVQGLAKSWCNLNGVGTIAIRSSQNVASLTDDGTGDYRTNFISNMSDANFSGVVITGAVTEGGGTMQRDEEVRGISSSHLGMFCFHTNSEAARDVEYFATSIHGDLA